MIVEGTGPALTVALVVCVLGIAAVIGWMTWLARTVVMLPGRVAQPWLDVLEGVRAASIEPANPAAAVALTHVTQAQD